MISVYEKSGKIYAYMAVLFLWIFCIRANDAYIYDIPSYTSEKADAISQGYDMMTSFGVIDEQSDNAWDNTIIWLYSDTKNIDFTYLYAVPDGMGINLCQKSFVQLNFNNLKSKYILTSIDGEIDSLCAERGKELIAEYGNTHVWKLR